MDSYRQKILLFLFCLRFCDVSTLVPVQYSNGSTVRFPTLRAARLRQVYHARGEDSGTELCTYQTIHKQSPSISISDPHFVDFHEEIGEVSG